MGLLDEELLQSRISPTPRNPILGLLSDFIAQGYDPRRTQQMQGISKFLMAPEISQTLDRLSYDPSGRSLFTGAGGLGGTTRMRPEALDAALAVAPMAGPAARLTRGLPVGASIKDVGKVFPTSIANRSEVKNVANDFADQFKQMGFDVTLDHSGSKAGASSYLRVSDPQTGRFLSKPIRISDHSKGARELDANINVLNPQKDFAKITSALNDMRAKGDTLVFKQDRYAQELIASGVKPKTAYQRAKTEIAENQPSPYPQQAALDLAQQRAALPVEQGGLGLPRSNTAEQRAKAMGFDMETYHGTNTPDIRSIDVNKSRSDVQYMPGFFTADNPNLAQNYGDIVMPFLQKKGTTILDRRAARQSGQEAPMLDTVYDKEKGILVTNNPENIRSRFAAFDPFRRSAAVAATMGAAAPDLLAAQQDEEMRKLQQLGLLGLVAP